MDFDRSSNPAFNDKFFDQATNGEIMTVSGTVNKCIILAIIMFCSATYTWKMALESTLNLVPTMMFGCIGAFIVSLITIFYRKGAPVLAPIYSILEGLALGGVSALMSLGVDPATGKIFVSNGLALNALGISVGILLLMLTMYKTGFLKLTDKLRNIILLSTCGIGLCYLGSAILKMFGIDSLLFSGAHWSNTVLPIVVAIVAAFNFLIDFDQVDRAVAKRSPLYMEWYCAFGLMVTLVWLYLEILKILAQAQRKR